jgi:large subunit ribosomal protein LP0
MGNKGKEERQAWKQNYFDKMIRYMNEYEKILMVNADNVSSKQFQQIRVAFRGRGDILMGKNTMMRKVIRGQIENNPAFERLLPHIRKNVGMIFTNEDLNDVRAMINEFQVQAPAKAGQTSDVDVVIPPQNTGLGPEKTSFFQALSVPTKISRGSIEITAPVTVLRPGDRVGLSEATLLNLLKISPFTFGLVPTMCFDSGSVFHPSILDISHDDIRAKFLEGVQNVASVSLGIGYPTLASVPHSIANGFKNLLAVAAATSVEFAEAETMKAYLADPSAFAAVETVCEAAEEEVVEAAVEESDEESDEDMGFGLFD